MIFDPEQPKGIESLESFAEQLRARSQDGLASGLTAPSCPLCGREVDIRYGRASERYFVQHPECAGRCRLQLRSWWGVSRASALEAFREGTQE